MFATKVTHSLLAALCLVILSSAEERRYTNDWVVRMTGGVDAAEELARELGYVNKGQLLNFPDTYLLHKRNHPTRSKREALHITRRINEDSRVEWAEQQALLQRTKRRPWPARTKRSNQEGRFNDDLWPHQWYLHDTRTMPDLPQLDMRVVEVWNMGFTGRGVVVTVMDDGLEWNHTDLIGNYDPQASWDTNSNDPDPFPKYDVLDSNSHGTRCAGEIAMTADNIKCGVGVAYNAKIGGIRMLDGDISDAVESVSLAFNLDHIDVFSASWGPKDDGMTVDGPQRLAVEALEKGVTKGRDGKGVIYVWAAGNGGGHKDNCNCDGYTSSIYTLSVGSASQHGQFPWYGERCASTMATAFSSGAYRDQKISTTDLHDKCTIDHTGTSAAAPLAAGVVALALEANSNLTWRDMQHLVAWTSDFYPLRNNKGWKQNGAGLVYNSRFGFGLLDAHSMVQAALNWTTVPEKTVCSVKSNSNLPLAISSGHETRVTFQTTGCKGTDQEVNYLEHVEVTVDIQYTWRGALELSFVSPSGSATMLLSQRELDDSVLGFRDWTFMTVHLWSEQPAGEWTLVIRDQTDKNFQGTINSASLRLHGTRSIPAHLKNGPKPQDQQNVLRQILDPSRVYFDEEVPEAIIPEDVRNRLDALHQSLALRSERWENPLVQKLPNYQLGGALVEPIFKAEDEATWLAQGGLSEPTDQETLEELFLDDQRFPFVR